MDYFPSAEAMAADLDLELLLRAEVDRRMLTRKERLSQFAADSTVAGHLYGRVKEQQARELGSADLRGKILWITAPFGTVEHLSWAVGLADQISRQKGRVYLAASAIDTLLPARTGVRGEALPEGVQSRLRSWLKGSTYAVGTDLEGVRMVVPVTAHDVVGPPAEARWTVLLVDPLPEDYDGPYPDKGSVDGVVLATAFRDHSVSELQESVAGLRRAKLPLLGVVGMGPKLDPETEGGAPPKRRPSIWRTEDTPPERKESAPRLTAVPGALGTGHREAEPRDPGAAKPEPEESTWAMLGRSGREGGGGQGRQPAKSATRPPSHPPAESTRIERPAGPRQPAGPRPSDPRRTGTKEPARPAAAQPVDPIRPMDPARPVEPIRPMNPGRPVDPIRPVDPVRPADPRQPVDPLRPKEPTPGRAVGPVPSRDGRRRRRAKRGGRRETAQRPGVTPAKPLGTEMPTGRASSNFEGGDRRTVWADLPRSEATAIPPVRAQGDAPARSSTTDRAPETLSSPSPPRPGPERPATPNVTPLRVTPAARRGGELTSEERSVALLSGWQRERERRATRQGRAVLWISSSVVLLGIVGAFYLMRPSLIASGRLPGWMGGASGTSAESAATRAEKTTPQPKPDPIGTQSNDAVSEWDVAERDALLADLRDRDQQAAATQGASWEEVSSGAPPSSGAFPEAAIREESTSDPAVMGGRVEESAAGMPATDPRSGPPARAEAAGAVGMPATDPLSPVRTEESAVSTPASDSPPASPVGTEESASGTQAMDPAPMPPVRTEEFTPTERSMSDPEPLPPATQPGALEPATTDPAPIPGSDSRASDAPVSGTSSSQAAVSGASALDLDRLASAAPIVEGSTVAAAGGTSNPTRSGPSAASDSPAISGAASEREAASSGSTSESPNAAGITPADSPASGSEPSSDEEPGIPIDSVDPAPEPATAPESATGSVTAEPVGAQTPVDAESAYVVHLGSFRLRREADAEVARLQGLGYDARALHVNVPGKGPWYRVVIGAFSTFAEARQSALVLGESTGRTRPNVVGAGGYGAPVPVLEESESPGTATP